MTFEQYEEARKLAQSCAMGKGTFESDDQIAALACALGGMSIEATLPYKAGALLGDNGGDVSMHCIFQSGINFAGLGGGGIAIPPTCIEDVASRLTHYTKQNAKTAILSASKNESDVLVYNLGIGIGFFAGNQKDLVKQKNIEGFLEEVQIARDQGSTMEIVVPNIGYSQEQHSRLTALGVRVINADKDKVAALCARGGLKVSVSVAADPMSMLGIHGPGLWWETAGSASDEERAAFVSDCYQLAYGPINVYSSSQGVKKIAAISEFMVD